MKGRGRRLTVKARNVLFLVAIVAALTPFSHHSYFATQAQTGSAESLAAPALSASSTGAKAAALRWNAVSGAARYKLWAWWKGVTTAGSNWTAATTEREALTAVYEATNGANWKHSDNWLTELPISTWYGVYTDASGRVTALDLSSNGLHGPLPDLSALTGLYSLDLSTNKLSGPVPDLSALTNLNTLSLHTNQLVGEIPDLSALTNLEWMALSNNRLTGPIPDLSALTGLYSLDLSTNQLSGLVPDLSALTDLEWLFLNNNRLTGPIPDLSALTGLYSLDLSTNKLSGLVPDLSALTNLNALSLHTNQLVGEIPDLSALTNLEWMALSNNRLTGPVPDLNALTKLTTLDLSGNRLCLPEELSFPGSNADVTAHLKSLDLPSCTSAEIKERAALVALYETTNGADWKRNDNWLTELPVTTWYGVSTDASGRVTELLLARNGLHGPFPDLSALTSLTKLYLASNQLTGRIPAMDALTSLVWMSLSQNQLTGPIPDLSFLTNLTMLNLSHNRLTGPIPDLTFLTSLEKLSLSHNELNGRIPDLSFLTKLTRLDLRNNELTGPVVDLRLLTRLNALYLSENQLTGPAPDLSGFTNLKVMRLTDNQLCLSPGFAPSGPNSEGAFHLKKLNLATCTDAELSATPAAPSNLTPNSGAGQITLTWDRVDNAATYELRAWDSLQRQWGLIDGVLTGTSFTHSVLTDGRNYYYQVRSRDADGGRSAWSGRVYAAVVPPLFPPPPESLDLDIFYQKYFDAGGVVVVAPNEVSDKKMVQAQEILSGLLPHLPGLLETLVANRARIAIFEYKEGVGGVIQLPEFRHLSKDPTGMALRSPTGWVAAVPEDDYYCGLFVHEFAHLVHFAIEMQLNSGEYNSRLIDAYNSAMNAGLWQDAYASTNTAEYFAEAVKFWFWGSLPEWVVSNSFKLEDYDPEAAKLVKEVFGEATVPWYCKP
ncbi:MAG: hypothetical protein OXI80_15045 [Caldilineaceae bacterium]|nr:hypothetical protein [Caldilineaceae bacterium]